MTSFQKIDRYRIEMGWSGAELARKLSLSSGVYSQWKTGKQKPSMSNLKKLSELFHVNVSDLLDDKENKNTATIGDGIVSDQNVTISQEDARLLEWFRALPPEKQKAILVSQDAPEGLL